MHETDHLLAVSQRQCVDDRIDHAVDQFAGTDPGGAFAPCLAMDADAELHLVGVEFEGRRRLGGHGARVVGHRDAPRVVDHTSSDPGDSCQGVATRGRRAADLLDENCRSGSTTTGTGVGIRRDVVGDDHVVGLDVVAYEVSSDAEVHHVAGVVLHDVENACAAIGPPCRADDLQGVG